MYLTEKDKETFNCIKKYILEHGYAPSYREIGEMTELKSTSSIYQRVHRLFNLGLLETNHDEGTPRAMRIPGTKMRIPKLGEIIDETQYEF